MAQKRRPAKGTSRKKKRRRRRFIKRILNILCVLAVLTFTISLIYTVFHVKKINVTGNQYAASQEIIDWMKKDRFSDNSLYLLIKYNQDNIEQLPSVESVTVKLKSPWIVEVQVHEKEFVGGIRCGTQTLYFDSEGIACFMSSDRLEEVPYIEGIEADSAQVKLGEKIPGEDFGIYQQISEISKCMTEQELIPDKILYEDSGITLYLGQIRILLGNDGFEEKLQQVPPILKELKEQYAELTGTLHLENYDTGNTTIRFVPDNGLEDNNQNQDQNQDEEEEDDSSGTTE